MSQKDESQIRYRLKVLSRIEPSSESSRRAVQNVRDALENQEIKSGSKIVNFFFSSRALKFAAAAVLLIGVGFIAGRLLAPAQPDLQELQAALEVSLKSSLGPAIRQDLLEQINKQWQQEYAINYAQIKNELQQQISLELTEFAEQTLAASSALTDQRLKELIQLIEAARIKDRQWIAAALEKIELNRRQDTARIGGLVRFAAQTNRLRQIDEN